MNWDISYEVVAEAGVEQFFDVTENGGIVLVKELDRESESFNSGSYIFTIRVSR